MKHSISSVNTAFQVVTPNPKTTFTLQPRFGSTPPRNLSPDGQGQAPSSNTLPHEGIRLVEDEDDTDVEGVGVHVVPVDSPVPQVASFHSHDATTLTPTQSVNEMSASPPLLLPCERHEYYAKNLTIQRLFLPDDF